MVQRTLISLLILVLASLTPAQTAVSDKATAEQEKLRKEAVEMLRETMVEVGTMRTLENRLSFGTEMASLMWFHDEKEAKAMFNSVTADFQKLLFDLDRQLNTIEAEAAAAELEDDSPAFSMSDMAEKMSIERKLNKILELRQQIAMSAAEHEPDLALSFYYSSITALTNKEFLARAAARDSSFEVQLMTQVAETNAAKAASYAVKSLDKGFTHAHLDLLKKLYKKDADKGIEFAAAIVSYFKSHKLEDSDPWLMQSLVNFGEETTPKPPNALNKKPVLTNSQLRDLVEVLAAAMMADDQLEAPGFMPLFEKYTPTRAAQLKAKYRNMPVTYGSNHASLAAMNTAANAMNSAAYAANAAANVAASSPAAERRAKALEDRIETERKVMEDVASLGTKTLPKEEREKIITQARKLISKYGGKEQKIGGLSALAAQVAKAGDKELALEIMKEAESLVSTQPKNYSEYMLTWLIISGYAEVDTGKAFPMLTDTIFRLNTTIDAFARAAEFIDITGEMIVDGEVQVGQFGGSMLRGLTKELKIAEPTLKALAKSDFSKTKALTNTFDRTEVRILAKMLVLRTILDDKEKDPDAPDPNIGLVLN